MLYLHVREGHSRKYVQRLGNLATAHPLRLHMDGERQPLDELATLCRLRAINTPRILSPLPLLFSTTARKERRIALHHSLFLLPHCGQYVQWRSSVPQWGCCGSSLCFRLGVKRMVASLLVVPMLYDSGIWLCSRLCVSSKCFLFLYGKSTVESDFSVLSCLLNLEKAGHFLEEKLPSSLSLSLSHT